MLNKILLLFLVADGLFAATGGLLVAFVFIEKAHMNETPNMSNVAPNLLLGRTPLTGALVDAALIFFTFVVSLPGLLLPGNRLWLKAHSWLVIGCASVTLILGLEIWFSTLQTRASLGVMWGQQTSHLQSLLQQKFNCCGYTTLPFQQDAICTNTAMAAQMPNCVGPFGNFANGFLDLIFTAMFGLVALDTILFLCAAMVLKNRAENERYRHIDEKIDPGTI